MEKHGAAGRRCVALCWLLLMTLWLPLLDYARSARPFVTRLAVHVPRDACIAAPGIAPATVAALEYFGGWRVDARVSAVTSGCGYLLRVTRAKPSPLPPPGWDAVAEVRRPTERDEVTQVFRRAP